MNPRFPQLEDRTLARLPTMVAVQHVNDTPVAQAAAMRIMAPRSVDADTERIALKSASRGVAQLAMEVLLKGGGATHPAWRQLLADALGMPLQPADTSWLSPAGAARLAAAAAGMEGAGDARARSGYGRAVPVVPLAPDAASAGYARFTHKLAASEIGPIRRDERKVRRDNHPHGRR